MKKALFAELMESMREALEYARGDRELRTTVHPAAPAQMTAKELRAARAREKASNRASQRSKA